MKSRNIISKLFLIFGLVLSSCSKINSSLPDFNYLENNQLNNDQNGNDPIDHDPVVNAPIYDKKFGTNTSNGISVPGNQSSSVIVSINAPLNVLNPLANKFGINGYDKNEIPNKFYAQTADISFAITSYVRGLTPRSGTAWILDYKKEENGNYPLTWYLGSNIHVLDDVFNDQNYNGYSIPQNLDTTHWIQLKKIANPKTEEKSPGKIEGNEFLAKYVLSEAQCYGEDNKCKIKKDDGTNNLVKDYDWDKILTADNVTNREVKTILKDNRFVDNFKQENYSSPFKLIYLGLDYLNSKPNDYAKYFSPEMEEAIDFGVLEVTFPNEIVARTITANYANKNDAQILKFREKSYVENYKTFLFPNGAGKM